MNLKVISLVYEIFLRIGLRLFFFENLYTHIMNTINVYILRNHKIEDFAWDVDDFFNFPAGQVFSDI